jgi:hypothetical protein
MIEKEIRTCTDCDITYVLHPPEIKWFTERNLALPRRCRSCREARRLWSAEREQARLGVRGAPMVGQ